MTDKKFTDEEIIKALMCHFNRQRAEIERLKGSTIVNNIMESQRIKREAKAEAYKEFAEKLKKKCYEDFEETDEMLAPYVTEDNIDNLLKEMVGEEK